MNALQAMSTALCQQRDGALRAHADSEAKRLLLEHENAQLRAEVEALKKKLAKRAPKPPAEPAAP